MDPLIWLIILAICLVAEIITLGLSSIWFAGGALVAFLLAKLGVGVGIQWVAFFTISIVLLYFTKPLARKYLDKNIQSTNLDSIIGTTAVVSEDISNAKSEGTVNLKGQIWTARSENDLDIPKESIVRVVRIEGVKLIVTLEEQEHLGIVR